jgi:hypothetical protein
VLGPPCSVLGTALFQYLADLLQAPNQRLTTVRQHTSYDRRRQLRFTQQMSVYLYPTYALSLCT